MAVTIADVHNMAKLSRLEVDCSELDLFVKQFDSILEHMKILQTVPVDNLEPLYTPLQFNAYLRSDAARNLRTREEILANAPETDGEAFIVPRIV